jgi:transcriptional regulator with XRE-family HTH domain
MPIRSDALADAQRRVAAQLQSVSGEIRRARLVAGVAQREVARAAGCSRQLVSAIETGSQADIGVMRLARIAAVVGLDVSIRAFVGERMLADAGQLQLLARLRQRLASADWAWRTEVPVALGDRRSFDAVLRSAGGAVAIEAVTRLVDAQAQVRAILLKQRDASIGCVVLALADTRHNRQAVPDAEPTLGPAFPLRGHAVMRALRTGRVPSNNALLLV